MNSRQFGSLEDVRVFALTLVKELAQNNTITATTTVEVIESAKIIENYVTNGRPQEAQDT